ncbi:MAG: Coenzyme F420 hydrogenase/dehydrogenase, beta subunit C-terminal domain [Candidatus Methanoperedens sp.]|nr:Coenzyme F420 hydrogenase/dehydrogenase, beta subunit C-terminal domain [Candidatus Methanoperedens sp.]
MEKGNVFVGWSINEEVRKRGGSGGLVTSVLAAALDKKLVDAVVVLKKINEFEAVPVITSDVDEVLNSAGSLHSVPSNFAKLIADKGMRIAVPGKGCDVRAIIEQGKRNAVNLDNTFIIGLNCGGSMHPAVTREMLETVYNIKPDDVEGEEIEKGKLIFKTKYGNEKGITIDELEEKGYGRRESCRYCAIKIPANADLACGNWGVTGDLAGRATFVEVNSEKGAKLLQNAIDAGMVEVTKPEDKGIAIRGKIKGVMEDLAGKWKNKVFEPVDDRLALFRKELENCIDCGACKTVCPTCSCGEVSKCTQYHSRADGYKMSMFHLTRFLHLADSCIGCGQCTDVCPADIPLTRLYRRFANPVQDELGYEPGMDMRKPPYFEVKLNE